MSDNLPIETQEEALPSLSEEGKHFLENAKAFEHGQRVAKLFAASKLVPSTFQGNIPDCFIALHMASRMSLDPLYFMQHCYVIHGKPAVDGQLTIAVLNKSGRYRDGVEFEYSGSGDTRKCIAKGVRANSKIDEAEVSVAMAKAAGWYERNPNWKILTDQMLAYRAATFLARKYCPNLLGGMGTIEEQVDIDGVTVIKSNGSSEKLNQLKASLKNKESG